MPKFKFWVENPPANGGVDEVVITGPWVKVVNGPNGQYRDGDEVAAGRWLAMQVGIKWASGNVRGAVIPETPQPQIWCIHKTEPSVSAQSVNAGQPVGPPVANGRNYVPPPQVTPKEQVKPRQGEIGYDAINEAGLPSSQDSFLDADPTGGTYTDIDVNGAEEVRPANFTRQAGPNIHQRES